MEKNRRSPKRAHTRRRRQNAQRLARLVALFPEFALSGPGPLGWALATLRAQLRDSREVAARLVDIYGPRVRLLLHRYRKQPEVAVLFAPSPASTPDLVGTVVALVRRGEARPASVEIARVYGLGAFDELNAHARVPEIRELLQLKPRKRPKGSTTRDLEAHVVTEVHAALAESSSRRGAPRAALLRFLGRNPQSATGGWLERSEKTADAKWFRRRLKRGRELRNGVPSPAAPTIAFLSEYMRDLPAHERLRVLIQFLAPIR